MVSTRRPLQLRPSPNLNMGDAADRVRRIGFLTGRRKEDGAEWQKAAR